MHIYIQPSILWAFLFSLFLRLKDSLDSIKQLTFDNILLPVMQIFSFLWGIFCLPHEVPLTPLPTPVPSGMHSSQPSNNSQLYFPAGESSNQVHKLHYSAPSYMQFKVGLALHYVSTKYSNCYRLMSHLLRSDQ
jgi:hypothetical protein